MALAHAAHGFSANAFVPVSLFLGTDCYLGSFFGFMAIAYQGPAVGLAVLSAAALGSLIHGDFGFCAVSLIEALCAFLYFRRGGRNVALADTGFWALGLWLVAAFRLLGDFTLSEALLSGAMIAAFGVFAASAASLLSDYARRLPSGSALVGVLGYPHTVPFRRIVFETSCILAMVPFILFMVMTSWTRIQGLEREVGKRLESLTDGYTRMMPVWMEAKISRLASLAREAASDLGESSLRGMLNSLESSGRDLVSVGLLDAEGKVIASASDPALRPSQGLESDLSGTRAFSDARDSGGLAASLEAGAAGTSLVLFAYPMTGAAEGRSVYGLFTIDSIAELLESIAGPTRSRGWIVDRAGRVVAAYSPAVPPGGSEDFRGAIDVGPGSRPALLGAPRAYARASFSQSTDAGFGSGWKAVFVIDLGPLYGPVIVFALTLALFAFASIALIVLASAYTSKIVVSSLERLGRATRSFMDRFLGRESLPPGSGGEKAIDWPEEGVEEVFVLSRAFQEAGEALDRRYRENLAALDLAERANRAKRDLLSAVSHDIRGPLAGIVGVAERLESDLEGLVASADARLIKETGSRLSSFVEELLDRSALDDGRIELRSELFFLRDFFDSTIGVFSASARRKGLGLDASFDERLPAALVGDRARLFQILGNLIGNAVKYTASGRIGVSASLEAEEGELSFVRFEVADTGPGIESAHLEKIFDPYYRIDERGELLERGLGLGLHLARGLARLMGSDVLAESVLGKGSRFSFVVGLPRAEPGGVPVPPDAAPSPSAPPAAEEPPADARPAAAPRVLIVDDLDISRSHARRILELAGCAVAEAADGAAAVEAALASEFDAVFMDIDLPILDGRSAARAILDRPADRGKRRPLVFAFTAYASAGEIEAFEAEGFDGHVAKNGEAGPLLDAVKRAYYRDSGAGRPFEASAGPRRASLAPAGRAKDGILDIEGLLAAYQGNREFLKTLLRTFVSDGRQRVVEMRRCLGGGEGVVLERALHSLVNICGSGRAARALELLRGWESSLREGRAPPEPDALAALAEVELAILAAEAYLAARDA